MEEYALSARATFVMRTIKFAGVLVLAFAGYLVFSLLVGPPNSYNLFCTYDLTYRLNVTIEADGEQLYCGGGTAALVLAQMD
jgi:hypothetical protein